MNIIWDLDGTIIDSYPVIVDSLYEMTQSYEINHTKEYIYQYIKNSAVYDYLLFISNTMNQDIRIIRELYSIISQRQNHKIIGMKNIKETLEYLSQHKVINFIYTHKGISTYDILEQLHLTKYFKEIVTKQNNFKRKPDPEAIFYLIEKYQLNYETTYYIGDRAIDVDCAKNAGIYSIFLNLDDNDIKADYVIKDLLELTKLKLI